VIVNRKLALVEHGKHVVDRQHTDGLWVGAARMTSL
jgi:hypothetical protein